MLAAELERLAAPQARDDRQALVEQLGALLAVGRLAKLGEIIDRVKKKF